MGAPYSLDRRQRAFNSAGCGRNVDRLHPTIKNEGHVARRQPRRHESGGVWARACRAKGAGCWCSEPGM